MASNNSGSSSPENTVISVISSVPAATPVDHGRFIMNQDDRAEFEVGVGVAGGGRLCVGNSNDVTASDDSGIDATLPNSITPNQLTNTIENKNDAEFDINGIFESIQQPPLYQETITDQDLDRLLGPLPRRNNTTTSANGMIHSLEQEEDDELSTISQQRRRHKRNNRICPCCPASVKRGPLALFAMTGVGGDAVNAPKLGNMIVVLPQCYYRLGFGIMGPHWCGYLSWFATRTLRCKDFDLI
jgi:hypothetical protein